MRKLRDSAVVVDGAEEIHTAMDGRANQAQDCDRSRNNSGAGPGEETECFPDPGRQSEDRSKEAPQNVPDTVECGGNEREQQTEAIGNGVRNGLHIGTLSGGGRAEDFDEAEPKADDHDEELRVAEQQNPILIGDKIDLNMHRGNHSRTLEIEGVIQLAPEPTG